MRHKLAEILNYFHGLRKLIVTLCVFTISLVLLVLGKISSAEWIDLNKIVIPAFLAANLGEYWLKKKNDNSRPPQNNP